MAIVSASTGRWAAVLPRRPVPYRPSSFDPTGRWHFVDLLADRNTEPYRDDDTMQLVDDLVDCLIVCRSGSTYDAGARLSVTASLIAELEPASPRTSSRPGTRLQLGRDRRSLGDARVNHPTALQPLRRLPEGDAPRQHRLKGSLNQSNKPNPGCPAPIQLPIHEQAKRRSATQSANYLTTD